MPAWFPAYDGLTLHLGVSLCLILLWRLMSAPTLSNRIGTRPPPPPPPPPPPLLPIKEMCESIGQVDDRGRICATCDCYLVRNGKVVVRPGERFRVDPRLRTLENFATKEQNNTTCSSTMRDWFKLRFNERKCAHIDGLYCESTTVGKWMDIMAAGANCSFDLDSLEPVDVGRKVKSAKGVEMCASDSYDYAEVILTSDRLANNGGRRCNALLHLHPHPAVPKIVYFVRYKDRFIEGPFYERCSLGERMIVWRRGESRFERFKHFSVKGKKFYLSRDLDNTYYEDDTILSIPDHTHPPPVTNLGYWTRLSDNAKKCSHPDRSRESPLEIKDGILRPTAPQYNVFKVDIDAQRIHVLPSHPSLEPLVVI